MVRVAIIIVLVQNIKAFGSMVDQKVGFSMSFIYKQCILDPILSMCI